MARTIISIAFLLAACLPTVTAHAEKVGTWTLYKSFNNITEIAPAGNQCFALASGSLFGYNTASGELAVYNKTNALSDSDIKHIRWSATAKRLVIAYGNGNIDLLAADGTTTNVPDLYMSATSKDKTINHIFIDGQYAYLATGLGVLKLDTRRGVIPDTYQFDFGIDYAYTDGGYIYAASYSHGLYRGKLIDNLLDHANWQRVGDPTTLNEDRTNVKDPTTNLWWTRGDNGKLTYYTLDDEGNRSYKTEGVLPDGPASNHSFKLYVRNGVLYNVGGLYLPQADMNYPGEVDVWDGQQWSQFEVPDNATTGHRNTDFLCMAFDPMKEGHVMVGAKSGLYEYQDGKFIVCYNRNNSPLQSVIQNDDYIILSGLTYDNNGTLWLFNSAVTNCVWNIDRDGKWTAVEQLASAIRQQTNTYLASPIWTNNGTRLWMVNNIYSADARNQMYVYDVANNQFGSYGPTFVNEDGNSFKVSAIYGAAEDKSGNIWMATSSGPMYLAPADIQSGIITQHKVPRNDGTNLADYLLNNVETRCITIDGANRKWIGTSNGVFLISDDCNTQVEHFTTENSPLCSDIVYDIAVDPNSNMVYFATEGGLCSYASDATQPSDNMTKDNVYAYPNPVRPDYSGQITIVGLTNNADVKIVTSNGTLVNHGRSTGGSYRWDGRDLKGKRVASGVYMVETATESGGSGTVCKIAIIN